MNAQTEKQAAKGPKQELEAALKQAMVIADESEIASIRSSSLTKAGGQANKTLNVTFADGRALTLSIKPARPKKQKA